MSAGAKWKRVAAIKSLATLHSMIVEGQSPALIKAQNERVQHAIMEACERPNQVFIDLVDRWHRLTLLWRRRLMDLPAESLFEPDDDGAACCPDPGCPGNPCTFPGYADNH